jgi:hypothetical protein
MIGPFIDDDEDELNNLINETNNMGCKPLIIGLILGALLIMGLAWLLT